MGRVIRTVTVACWGGNIIISMFFIDCHLLGRVIERICGKAKNLRSELPLLSKISVSSPFQTVRKDKFVSNKGKAGKGSTGNEFQESGSIERGLYSPHLGGLPKSPPVRVGVWQGNVEKVAYCTQGLLFVIDECNKTLASCGRNGRTRHSWYLSISSWCWHENVRGDRH